MCAHGLRGKRVLVLDVGHRPERLPDLEGNIFELRKSRDDLFEQLIGSRFESLHNLHRRTVSLKLKGPHMTYIRRDWEELSPIDSDGFEPTISLAEGGLANAWGAGAYRFTAEDLAGFPVGLNELQPYYDEVTRLIGICGQSDDLDPHFGTAAGLLPPLRPSAFFKDLYARYQKKRPLFLERDIAIGLPRLAVLTQDYDGRPAYRYENLEFFKPLNPSVYNPSFTLRRMMEADEISYRPGYLVTSYVETPSHVDVIATNVASGESERFAAQTLFLGAGALNSARIVLASAGDHETRLPLLDNPMSCFPLFKLDRIGQPLGVHDSSLAQLNLICREPDTGETLQAAIYGTTGPLRSDIVFSLPVAASSGLVLAKYMSSAMALVMLFYPGRLSPDNHLRLGADGRLRLQHSQPQFGAVERRLIAAFRALGYLSSVALCQYPRIGSALHYAGTLPMKSSPGRYETNADGRLSGSRRVYVVDGGSLTRLPAKNLTLTIMANAKRIASRARESMV
jgi:choline dehydrogenase-like flavoprotein